MSKAFQCDNCLECFVGDAHKVLPNGDEVCSDCLRVIKALSTINPVARIKLRSDRPGDWEPIESPPHTGQHSF